jgi:hypothetical protein
MMKSVHCLLVLLLALFAGACVLNRASTALNSNQVTLENGVLSLTVKRTSAPHVVRLVAKATGTNLISEPSDPALFAIMLAKQGGQDYVDISLARKTTMEVSRTATGSQLLLTYSDFPNLVRAGMGELQ